MKAIFCLTSLIAIALIAVSGLLHSIDLPQGAVMEAPAIDHLPGAYRDLLAEGTIIPSSLPAKITDPFLLAAWITLYNHTESITIHDGIVVSGRSLADVVLLKDITVLWGSDEVCNGNSCSLRPQCPDTQCVVEYQRTKLNPIHISQRYNEVTAEMVVRLAGSLAHELYHYQWPFGPVQTTLFEEYWAYYIGSQIREDGWGDFSSYDPYNAAQLQSWFSDHGVQGYYTVDVYPFTLLTAARQLGASLSTK